MTPLVGSVFVVVCACVINYIIVNNIRIVHELTRTAGADLGFIKGGLTQGTNLLGRGSEVHFPACEACWN